MDETGAKTEQTAEIEAVLGAAREGSGELDKEWSAWEDDITAKVEKLMASSRIDRLAILAMGGLGLMAVGVSAMALKGVQNLMGAINQLAENQNFIAKSLGMANPPDNKAPDMTPYDEATANGHGDLLNELRVDDPKTFDIPPDSVVGKPHSGPVTEASEEARRQLAADKEAGIIDLAKEEEVS